MHKYENKINESLDNLVIWERLDNKKASRIKYEMPLKQYRSVEGKFNDKTNWKEWVDWYEESMIKFYKIVLPIWEKVQKELAK